MGQKVNPKSLRLGVIRTWDSLWYASGAGYAKKLHEDLAIRNYINKTLSYAGVSKVDIERPAKKTRVIIHSSRPGLIIGKKGSDINKVKKHIEGITSNEVSVNILEVKKPETDPNLVAAAIAQQLEKRVSFRKAAKRSIQSAMRMGAKGIKVSISGRLGGADIARTERYREGQVPLHTVRADIDYGLAEAQTTYGVIGVKVWVYYGEKPKLKSESII